MVDRAVSRVQDAARAEPVLEELPALREVEPLGRVLLLLPARADADLEPPAREHVERGDRLRGQKRIAVGRDQHVRLHTQPRGRRRHERERHEGVERLMAAAAQPAVLGRGMVGDEGGVEARAFGRLRHLGDRLGAHELLARGDAIGRELEREPHGPPR